MAITEEGITNSAGKHFSSIQKEIYLTNVLQLDLRHLSHNNKAKLAFVPERYRTEVASASEIEAFREQKKKLVVGITMSPLSSLDLDYHAVLTQTSAKLVLYIRTNVVKFAAAMIRGTLVTRNCHGAHNIKKGSVCEAKVSSEQATNYSVVQIVQSIENAISRNSLLLDIAHNATSPSTRFHMVVYERLQIDRSGELQALKEFLGIQWRGDEEEKVKESDSTMKTTSEDLRNVFTNFDGLLDFFERGVIAARDGRLIREHDDSKSIRQGQRHGFECLVAMLRATRPTPFDKDGCLLRGRFLETLKRRDGDSSELSGRRVAP